MDFRNRISTCCVGVGEISVTQKNGARCGTYGFIQEMHGNRNAEISKYSTALKV